MQAVEAPVEAGFVDETQPDATEVRPLTKRKKKVKHAPEPNSDKLNGSLSLNSTLTEPWCGRLETTEDPGPHPGPFNTSLFWIRHQGPNLPPIHGRVNGGLPADPASVRPSVEGPGSQTYAHQNGLTQTGREVTPDSSPSIAPWKQGKPHTHVFLRVTFRKVGQVDTVSETFNADVTIQARWLHSEHLYDTKTDPCTGTTTKEEWSPLLYIENTRGNIIKVLGKELWTSPRTGEEYVIERLTARGTFTETMELDHFPFDCQNLTVTVASDRSSEEITLTADPLDPSYLHLGNFVDKQEWHLFEHVETHEPEGYESDIATTLTRRPALSFTCQASRKIGYFTWNVFLLLAIIFLMHLCSFSVAKTAYNARLSSSFTMFLTAIAFKIALNQYLPRISYLTYMDSYLLIQLVMMAFVCGWHATVAHLATSVLTEQIMVIIISVLYVIFQVVFIAVAYFIPGKKRRELYAKHKAHRKFLLRKSTTLSSYA